jgi:hypothetical protein
MQTRRGIALILACLPLGCSDDGGAARAMQTVDAFQAALRAGDVAQCRGLVTRESAAALASIPWDRVREQQALRVVGAERGDSFHRVRVEDPNEGGRPAEFIVVREYGRVVVDLVASAGLTAEFVERPVDGGDFAPRELSPADVDRIRQRQLAAPPR